MKILRELQLRKKNDSENGTGGVKVDPGVAENDSQVAELNPNQGTNIMFSAQAGTMVQ